ncbi:hypothetical protein DFA_08180 [Cavenderia fasciculata]|uniref:Uncharacterized protein n=1 Tax=Cavenderia fasciculata TaxID=261658 RepID=F4Q5D4_CACFS|nr:uncharacterized protein DFA_08180 [Cavenderia fasciculata]EGG17193.1 hypothetical protein DFA_08180 [Cavenderia fasciculata]|eukprot:XP_004355677.1 hypothetical protein DFA_08180 [Cavenderia fasciculata]
MSHLSLSLLVQSYIIKRLIKTKKDEDYDRFGPDEYRNLMLHGETRRKRERADRVWRDDRDCIGLILASIHSSVNSIYSSDYIKTLNWSFGGCIDTTAATVVKHLPFDYETQLIRLLPNLQTINFKITCTLIVIQLLNYN